MIKWMSFQAAYEVDEYSGRRIFSLAAFHHSDAGCPMFASGLWTLTCEKSITSLLVQMFIPQALKHGVICGFDGTAKAVPFPD
jgi:hypothetical protein